MVKTTRGVSLVEILLALVLLGAVFVGITSFVYSEHKHTEKFRLSELPLLSEGWNFLWGEFGKVSLTSPSTTTARGTYEQIGEGSVSGFTVWRTRVDLDGDGEVGNTDPVFVYMEMI